MRLKYVLYFHGLMYLFVVVVECFFFGGGFVCITSTHTRGALENDAYR